MERGLMWLPLLALFLGLAWAGWNEYQKVEAYKQWATSYNRAKYDIYAALGQTGDILTWGKPTRRGVIDTHSLSLHDVSSIAVRVGDRTLASADLEPAPPSDLKGRAALEFHMKTAQPTVTIPFTDVTLATQWAIALDQDLRNIQESPSNVG